MVSAGTDAGFRALFSRDVAGQASFQRLVWCVYIFRGRIHSVFVVFAQEPNALWPTLANLQPIRSR